MAQYRMNEYDQPVGLDLPDWTKRSRPCADRLEGQYCRLEHLDFKKHKDDLFEAYRNTEASSWTYLPHGPFQDEEVFSLYLSAIAASNDPFHYAIIDYANGKAMGSLSLMRIDTYSGVVEVGHIIYSDALKKSRVATETQYLLMRYVFDDLGYRRYEWKCDALNAPSRAAASRLGFQYEGIFRNAVIYKNRTRDTAWYAMIEEDWPALKEAFCSWLNEDNFDEEGRQISKLEHFRKKT